MYSIILEKRQSGRLMDEVNIIAALLRSDGVCSLITTLENDYANTVTELIEKHHNIKVDTTRLTSKEPRLANREVYDAWGGYIGIEEVEQEDVFIGWKLKRK